MDLTATSKLPDPLSLDGNIYQNWTKFRQEFDDYLTSIEFDEKPDKVKTAKLRNLIGNEGRRIIVELQLEHSVDYDNLINKLEDWVKSDRNPTRERSKFFSRVQKEDETFEDFLQDVRNIIGLCNFGDFSEEILRDKIVSGILDCQLRELFYATPGITLESVVQMCRVADLSEEQLLKLLSLKKGQKEADIAAVKVLEGSNITNPDAEFINRSTKEASVQTDDNDAQSERTFRFTVKNVSELRKSTLSPPCYVHNLPWKIMLMQRSTQMPEKSQKSLGFFLQCNGESESTSWSCFAAAELKILPQKEGVEPICRKIQHLFFSKESDWGFSHFIVWNDMLDPDKGYIKDDAITLEIILKAEKPHGLEDLKVGICQIALTT